LLVHPLPSPLLVKLVNGWIRVEGVDQMVGIGEGTDLSGSRAILRGRKRTLGRGEEGKGEEEPG